MHTMLPTTRAGAPKQLTTEKPADDWIMEAIPNNVTINVLDGSWQEVYFRNQKAEQTPLSMKVYMGALGILTVLVMGSMFV